MMKLGEIATVSAELIDQLEEDYGDQEVEVGMVAIVVELTNKDEDGVEYTGVHFRTNETRRWVQHGFFSAAVRAVEYSSETSDEDDEDE